MSQVELVVTPTHKSCKSGDGASPRLGQRISNGDANPSSVFRLPLGARVCRICPFPRLMLGMVRSLPHEALC